MSDNRAMMLVRQASIDHSSQIEVQIFITPNFNFLWKKPYKNSSDVSWTFPDREFPEKFQKSHSREIFL